MVRIVMMELESNCEEVTIAIEVVSKSDAAACANAIFLQNPRVTASKITGVIKQKKKTPVIVIDDDNSEEEGYDTDDSNAYVPSLVKREYDSSDGEDEDKDVEFGTQDVEEEEFEVEQILPHDQRLVPALGRGQ